MSYDAYTASGIAGLDPYVQEANYGFSLPDAINSANAALTSNPGATQTATNECAWWQTLLYGCALNPGTSQVPSKGPGGLTASGVFGTGGTPVANIFGMTPNGPAPGVTGTFNVGGMDSSSTGQGGPNSVDDAGAWLSANVPKFLEEGGLILLGVILVALGLWVIVKP